MKHVQYGGIDGIFVVSYYHFNLKLIVSSFKIYIYIHMNMREMYMRNVYKRLNFNFNLFSKCIFY